MSDATRSALYSSPRITLFLVWGALVFGSPSVREPRPLIALLLLSLAAVSECAQVRGRLRHRLVVAVSRAAILGFACYIGSLVIREVTLYSVTFPALTSAAATMFQVSGIPVGLNRGAAFADFGGGAEPFVVTSFVLAADVALPAFASVAILALCSSDWRRANVMRVLGSIGAAGVFVLLVRPIVLIAAWGSAAVGAEEAKYASMVDIFASPWITWIGLAPLLLFLPSDTRQSPRPKANSTASVWSNRATVLCCFAATSLVVACARGFEGGTYARNGGVILFDDYHSDEWEQSRRLYDRSWFGDWSAYSYTLWAEWLGRDHQVRVVRTPLTEDLLEGVDLVVLKTPSKPYSADEREAILRFAAEGGGLLLIGDHTNLLGMNTHLNAIGQEAGMLLRNDGVHELLTHQQCRASPPPFGAFPGTIRLPASTEFMSPASIDLSLPARPLVTVRRAHADKGDLANRSYFGDMRQSCDEAAGEFCVAAIGNIGKGTVVVCADSTVFSNFTLFRGGHIELADSLTDLALRRGMLAPATRLVVGLAAAVAVLLAFRVLRREWSRARLAVSALALLAGFGGTSIAWDACARRCIMDSFPRHRPVEVHVISADCVAGYPPAIGATAVPAHRAFDHFVVALQRLGFKTNWFVSHEDLCNREDLCVLVNPSWDMAGKADLLQSLSEFVGRGGHLAILDSPDLAPHVASAAICDACGVGQKSNVAWVALPGLAHVSARRTSCGPGSVTVILGSTEFSRERMGHSFHVLEQAQRERMSDLLTIFETYLPMPGRSQRAPLKSAELD